MRKRCERRASYLPASVFIFRKRKHALARTINNKRENEMGLRIVHTRTCDNKLREVHIREGKYCVIGIPIYTPFFLIMFNAAGKLRRRGSSFEKLRGCLFWTTDWKTGEGAEIWGSFKRAEYWKSLATKGAPAEKPVGKLSGEEVQFAVTLWNVSIACFSPWDYYIKAEKRSLYSHRIWPEPGS